MMLNWTQQIIPKLTMTTEINNITDQLDPNSTADISWTYREGMGILMLICSLSMIVNTRVLLSVHWIKRPLSATLYISLSLAAADLVTSLIVFVNFILNSYLPVVEGVRIPSCVALVLEGFRLGGIVNTVLHLLFLACNHYLGIVRPLHYQSIMTHRKITACLVALWVLPPVYMLVYFSLYPGQGFQHEQCIPDFMKDFSYRLMFILLLVIPFLLMTLIYTHILVMVRRQQRGWSRAAERGSCRHRGGDVRRRVPHSADQRRNQQMLRNIKALHTTLLILGSFVAGLVPPIVVFILVCDTCAFQTTKGAYWSELFWFVNLLLVTKPLANPIIYAARMHEIKEATRRMRTSVCFGEGICRCCSPLLPLFWLCCGWSAYDSSGNSHMSTRYSQRGHWPRSADGSDSIHLYNNTSSIRVTHLCRSSTLYATKNVFVVSGTSRSSTSSRYD